MNPDDDTDDAEDRREQRAHKAPRSGRVSGGLALIFAFVALLVSGYLWYTLVYERPELMKINLPQTLADLQNSQADLKNAQDDTENEINALTETEGTLKAAVDKIQSELGNNRARWSINEAEQLLLIANRRLQLARDVSAALAALRAADSQLESLASPNLLNVRREIAKEITTLETLERTDIAGMALRLGSIADRADQLPFAPDLRARSEQLALADRTRPNETGTARSIWRDLLELVRIRRQDTAQRPLLAPEQQYFARENLRLMLYGAQHALLAGYVATYQQNLNTASRWLGDYFDATSSAVAAAQQDLEKLRATPVMNELPDITASLNLLRKAAERQREP